MGIRIRLIICCLLVIVAVCMTGIVIGHRGVESNRLKAEAVMIKAKTGFEKVKNRVPEELIDLIRTSMVLAFLLTCGTIALFAYFMHRILQQQDNRSIILHITGADPDLRFSAHEHYRIMNGKTDDPVLESAVRYSVKKRQEEP